MAQVITLGDLATIVPGTSIPGKIVHDPQGRCHLILPRHVDADGAPIHYQQIPEADRVRMTISVPKGRYLQLGDILFMARGESNRAAVIASLPDEPCTAPNVFLVLRPQKQVHPAYLAWALNQQPMQNAIRQIRTAHVATPMVKSEAFASLTCALPDRDQQQHMAALGDLMLREQQIQRRLGEAIVARNRQVSADLLTHRRVFPSKD